MCNLPRRHDNWLIVGTDGNGNRQRVRYLFYSRRNAIKRFRETHNCIGKHGVIEAVIPQFSWY